MPFPTFYTDSILTFQGVLPPDICASLIERFESDVQNQIVRDDPGRLSMTVLPVNRAWPDVVPALSRMFLSMLSDYYRAQQLSEFLPHGNLLEQMVIKRYLPNGKDAFPAHLDNGDHRTARRYLVMFVYLNDVTEGGHTTFPRWGVSIQPAQGTALLFPPWPPYVHAGDPPVSGPKYILSSYAHYA